MKNLSLHIGIFVAASLLWTVMPRPAMAQDGVVSRETVDKVTAIVTSTTEKVKAVLKHPDYEQPEKRPALREQIRQTLLDISDMRRITLLTLGMNRRRFDDQQFETLTDLFSKLLFSTYITHVEKSPDQSLEIRKIVRLSETRCQVQTMSTKVRATDKEVPIFFNFYEKDGVYMIDDMTVEGVSMVLNYRSQFNELLARMNPTDFLTHLQQKAEELEKNDPQPESE